MEMGFIPIPVFGPPTLRHELIATTKPLRKGKNVIKFLYIWVGYQIAVSQQDIHLSKLDMLH